ncbi:MAG TPA: phosphatase PAP2 family protein [Longimicrobiales bacterium]|nr:phosphatase PAP2 family protein [Longimicrobiales bacterium]
MTQTAQPLIPARFWVLAIVSIVLAHLLDPVAFRYLRIDDVYGEDWGRMLRVMGFVPLWIAGGAALMLEDRTPWRRLVRSRGGLVIAGSIVGGIAAELAKLVVRRRRPGELGEYLFRPFTERTFSTGGLGMPSSHALVAFGAAAVLARLFPRARIVWWGLAWGCGLSRVAAGAHFLSDVVGAAIIGWVVGALVWRWRAPDIQPSAVSGSRTPTPAAI